MKPDEASRRTHGFCGDTALGVPRYARRRNRAVPAEAIGPFQRRVFDDPLGGCPSGTPWRPPASRRRRGVGVMRLPNRRDVSPAVMTDSSAQTTGEVVFGEAIDTTTELSSISSHHGGFLRIIMGASGHPGPNPRDVPRSKISA